MKDITANRISNDKEGGEISKGERNDDITLKPLSAQIQTLVDEVPNKRRVSSATN